MFQRSDMEFVATERFFHGKQQLRTKKRFDTSLLRVAAVPISSNNLSRHLQRRRQEPKEAFFILYRHRSARPVWVGLSNSVYFWSSIIMFVFVLLRCAAEFPLSYVVRNLLDANQHSLENFSIHSFRRLGIWNRIWNWNPASIRHRALTSVAGTSD